jgi:serine/threonine protein kinase
MLGLSADALPGFALRRRIGAGAFGEVWDASGPDANRVALKFLDCRAVPPSLVGSEIRVLRSLNSLRHRNIIQYQGVFSSSHYIVLCMERADGNLEDLRQAYQDEVGRDIPADHVLELLGQAAEGLDFLAGVKLADFNASSSGLQHCDVKPSNLLLLGDTVKIADFGLCAGAGWKTHHKGWRGTQPYAAPELYHGRPTVGTDQFALAVTYLRLVGGDRALLPADPKAPPAMPVDLTKVRRREAPVIARALHPQPSARWPRCRDFIAAMREAVKSSRLVRRVR